jgi:hypothetical protein
MGSLWLPAFGLLAWVLLVWGLPERPVIDWHHARESCPAPDVVLGVAVPILLAVVAKTDLTAVVWISCACAIYVFARWEYCYKKTRREAAVRLWAEAHTVVGELDAMMSAPFVLPGLDSWNSAAGLDQARRARDEDMSRRYRQRFDVITRELARQFRRYRSTPTVDIFFLHATNGPNSEHDIFQIREGLLRLSQGVRESVTSGRG